MSVRTTVRYEVVMELACGGMGRVYLARRREERFERWLALKRMHPHLVEEAELREMFFDEARIAGLLRHANVVSVLDVGSDEEGPFLVMDFVDGLSLRQVLAHHAEIRQPLPMQLALRIVAQICAGLHAAHELRNAEGELVGLVHRDVSPGNVLLGFDGVARLTDFGIAKALDQSHRTATGVLKGKSSYMSPEQLRFERLDRRSDLFSVGVLLFQLVCGEHPFGSVHAERPRRILSGECEDLGEHRSDAPAALVELCYELLADDLDERPESARAVQTRLDALVGELAALEGPLDVAHYMERVFATAQKEVEAARRRAVASVPADRASAGSRMPGAGGRLGTRARAMGFLVLALVVVGVASSVFGGAQQASQVSDRADETLPPSPLELVRAAAVVSDDPADAGVEADSGVTKSRARRTTDGRRRTAMTAMRPPLWGWSR